MNLSINPYITASRPAISSASGDAPSASVSSAALTCPHCLLDIPADSQWENCPFCQQWLRLRLWPIVRQDNHAVSALTDQATCFFHPDRAFQACCNRCGRFLCALCDLQLGAGHVCPTCFERGRADSGAEAGKGDWRHRDVLYDSIALTLGWVWILIWPSIVAALPGVIFLHVKYRKAPRSYLIPRSGWRFWVAYAGFAWLPLLIAIPFFARWMARR